MNLPISKESADAKLEALAALDRIVGRMIFSGDPAANEAFNALKVLQRPSSELSPVSIERDESDNATSVTREDVEAVEGQCPHQAQTRQLRTTGATWALGVVMARLSIAETERIMASLPEPDLDRFAIAIEPLASDIARARSLSQPIERDVGTDARQDEPDAKLLTDSYEFTSDKGVPFPMSGRDVLQALRSGSGNLRWPQPPTESDVGTEAKQEAAPYTIAETYSYGDHRPFCGRCEAKRILRKLFWRGNAGWKCPECDPSAPSSSVSADEIEPAVLHSVHCRKYAIHTAFCDCVPGWQQTAARFEKERDKWRDLANRWIKAAMYFLPAACHEIHGAVGARLLALPFTTPTDTERLRFDRQALIDGDVFSSTSGWHLDAKSWPALDGSPRYDTANEALDALWSLSASRSSAEG